MEAKSIEQWVSAMSWAMAEAAADAHIGAMPPRHADLRRQLMDLTARLAAAGIEEARSEAWLLLSAATGRSRAELIAGKLPTLTPSEEQQVATLGSRRARREPMAYILGSREFWSLSFHVNPAVLVPRPESETVVEAALAGMADRSAPLRLLDLGTGSGCLLLALLSELPRATGIGVDRNAAALEVAKDNATRLGLAARAVFRKGDWGHDLSDRFDLIVSNPPYVARADADSLPPEVRAFEPEDALFAGPDGLSAYQSLGPDCARLLAKDGLVFMEIGQGQAGAVVGVLARCGLELAGSWPDLAGIERCLVFRRSAGAASGRRAP